MCDAAWKLESILLGEATSHRKRQMPYVFTNMLNPKIKQMSKQTEIEMDSQILRTKGGAK